MGAIRRARRSAARKGPPSVQGHKRKAAPLHWAALRKFPHVGKFISSATLEGPLPCRHCSSQVSRRPS